MRPESDRSLGDCCEPREHLRALWQQDLAMADYRALQLPALDHVDREDQATARERVAARETPVASSTADESEATPSPPPSTLPLVAGSAS